MDIDSLTVGELKQIQSFIGCKDTASGPYEVGKNYFIRSVTHHYTGRLVAVYPHELVVEDAAWIADDGRFATAMNTGEFAEIEPWPDDRKVVIGRQAVLDAVVIPFQLPRGQK